MRRREGGKLNLWVVCLFFLMCFSPEGGIRRAALPPLPTHTHSRTRAHTGAGAVFFKSGGQKSKYLKMYFMVIMSYFMD